MAKFSCADGSVYEGDVANGKPHGRGKRTFLGGETYEGEWKDGKPNGWGTGTWADGSSFVGQWKDGKPNGNGRRTYTWADGRSYMGQWKDGKQNGEGTHTLANGVKFKQDWHNGELKSESIQSQQIQIAANPQDICKPKAQPAEQSQDELQSNAEQQLRKKIEELEKQNAAKDRLVAEKDEELTKKDEELASVKTASQDIAVEKDKVIAQKDEAIKKMQDEILAKDKVIVEKDEAMAMKDAELASVESALQNQLGEKDEAIAEREDEIASLKAKLKKIAQMSSEEEPSIQEHEDAEEENHPAKRRRTESGHDGNENEQTNRASRSRARRVPIKQENMREGIIKCPQCNEVILHNGGCKRLTCTNHRPFLYFCAHCKKIGEDGSEIIRCDCPSRNTQADRDLAQEMRNQRSRENPEVVE